MMQEFACKLNDISDCKPHSQSAKTTLVVLIMQVLNAGLRLCFLLQSEAIIPSSGLNFVDLVWVTLQCVLLLQQANIMSNGHYALILHQVYVAHNLMIR